MLGVGSIRLDGHGSRAKALDKFQLALRTIGEGRGSDGGEALFELATDANPYDCMWQVAAVKNPIWPASTWYSPFTIEEQQVKASMLVNVDVSVLTVVHTRY